MSRKSRSSSGKTSERSGPPAIEAFGLVKSYGEVDAFACEELRIEVGEAVVLIGHNGSGKSTLLGMISGTLDPSEGSVEVHGEDPNSIESRARRTWLPDTPVLYDDLSVWEHLQFTSRLHGGTGEEPLLEELVERLGLTGREHDLPSQFSRGLRQKTAAAVALCRPFDLLCIDEPFVGLDASGRLALLDLLDEVHANGGTLLVATHDPAVIDRFERGLVLDNGEIVYDGPSSGLEAFLSADTAHHDK